MGDRAGSSPVTRTEKRGFGHLPKTPFLSVGGDLEPEVQGLGFAPVGPGLPSPGRCGVFASLRSAQNQGPLDLVRPVTRNKKFYYPLKS